LHYSSPAPVLTEGGAGGDFDLTEFWAFSKVTLKKGISMIVTCASCLTKFNLEDSQIPAKGAKVRCSRCKHVFYVVLPPETKEEVIENFESFAKYHEELMEPGEKKEGAPPKVKLEKEEVTPEEGGEETFLFSEKASAEKGEELPPEKEEKLAPPEEVGELPFEESMRGERVEVKPSRPKRMLRAERRGPSRFFALLVVLVILVFVVFFLWTELGPGGRLSSYLESPAKKINELWNQIWGVEKEDLIVGDLGGYEEKMGEIPLFIIEGKVKNQSRFTKKHIKIRVVIFDQDKLKVAEKEAICGRTIGRGDLKRQPVEFFRGEMVIKPQTKQEMAVPSGNATPFMVIFKDLPSQAKEFKVEILEAPNL
jgi:predicted Zn finger-like uncharacterized protein